MKWHWQDDELCDQWSVNADELRLMAGRTDPGKLGFAVLLKFFQYQGRFPMGNKELPFKEFATSRQTIMRVRDAMASDSN